MKIYHEDIPEINRYIDKNSDLSIEDFREEFNIIIKRIEKYISITPDTRMIEIGTGTGWFPIMCKLNGLNCKGLDISPKLIQFAKNWGEQQGVDPDIELGNIEESDIGTACYDVVLAFQVFEHVEFWENGLRKIFEALTPGGVLFFNSSNKFALKSGEYNFPLYGWLPNTWRYNLRKARQGKDIMKLGIDFNQFTHTQLRRSFNEMGFSKVLDWTEFVDPNMLTTPGFLKKNIILLFKKVKLFRMAALLFSPVTSFICIK